jgi:hypothetical protein
MINLNITYNITGGIPAIDHAEYLAAFLAALEAKGHKITCELQRPSKEAVNKQEKGEWEAKFLEAKGLSRMKVPSLWNGTREDFAKLALTNSMVGETTTELSEEVEEDDSDDLSILHD